jgi:hypothetical protein
MQQMQWASDQNVKALESVLTATQLENYRNSKLFRSNSPKTALAHGRGRGWKLRRGATPE